MRPFFSVVVAGLFLATANISFAEEGENFRYGLQGNNLVFNTIDEAIVGGSFQLAVKDGQRATISVALVDMVSNASGFKQSIPLNSSPFTPNGLVEFTKSYPAYQPSGEFQYFDISLKFKENIVLDRPVLGGLSISFVPEKQSEQALKVTSSIVATFAYLPATGLDLDEYAPALELLGPTIKRKTADFFPLNLLPDLPFLLNRGDVSLGYQLKNSGQIFLQTKTRVSIEKVGLFGQQDKEIFEQTDAAFLVPGQQTQQSVEVSPLDSEKRMLGIGVYRFTVAATGQIGDQIETSASNQEVMVLFPWKQSVLALGLLVIFRRRIGKAFNWFVGYARALRDFRYSAEAKPHQTLEANSIQEPEPKAAVKKKAVVKKAVVKKTVVKKTVVKKAAVKNTVVKKKVAVKKKASN